MHFLPKIQEKKKSYEKRRLATIINKYIPCMHSIQNILLTIQGSYVYANKDKKDQMVNIYFFKSVSFKL